MSHDFLLLNSVLPIFDRSHENLAFYFQDHVIFLIVGLSFFDITNSEQSEVISLYDQVCDVSCLYGRRGQTVFRPVCIETHRKPIDSSTLVIKRYLNCKTAKKCLTLRVYQIVIRFYVVRRIVESFKTRHKNRFNRLSLQPLKGLVLNYLRPTQ